MFFCVVTACADDTNEKQAAATSVSFIFTLCFNSMFFIALSLRMFARAARLVRFRQAL